MKVPTPTFSPEVARWRQKLIGHGSLVLLYGFVMGFGFLFFLIEKGLDSGASGHALLWPIPGKISVDMPGTYDAWRMAHMEGVFNGFALWIFAMILPFLPFGDVGKIRSGKMMIVVAWTIVIASSLDPLFADARGLRVGLNVANTTAFLLFYVGVVGVCVLVAVIAWKALTTEPEEVRDAVDA